MFTTDENGVRSLNTIKLHDIGYIIPNFDRDTYTESRFTFTYCGFHVVSDLITLMVVFIGTDGKSHYVFLNEDSVDRIYGFTAIT